jgi:hypothetical protein
MSSSTRAWAGGSPSTHNDKVNGNTNGKKND